MATLSVWSPRSEEVALELGGVKRPMKRCEGGWWRVEAPRLEEGRDYAFWINGEGPFPDPRSPWQPEGAHGPSRWIDHSRFAWTDRQWHAPPLASAVIYEMHIGTYTAEGTFAAAIEKLDHLVDLGVNFVEIMPVAQYDGRWGWGYDGVSLYAPHNGYGEPDTLKQLIDACHAKGIAAILDVVYNHVGPSGNYLERFGPYFTARHKTTWGKAVNLDGPGSDETRRFFIDNAVMWLRDYHFDGLRLDAVHAFLDISATHFLEELSNEVKHLGDHLMRPLFVIAESDLNDPRLVREVEVGGYGLDAQWNEDFHHSLHPLLTGEDFAYLADFGSVADLADTLRFGQVFSGKYSKFRDRKHGRPLLGVNGDRLVGCLQNHDQVGNRGAGERLSHLVDDQKCRLGAAVALLSPFVPLLFQGEEWASTSPFAYFTDFEDPELAQAVREGRQTEFEQFGWDTCAILDPQDEATFQSSKLRWSETGEVPHTGMLRWYRSLIELRRSSSDFTDGQLNPDAVDFDESERWLVLHRGRHCLIYNFSGAPRRIPVKSQAKWEIALASPDEAVATNEAIVLPPYGMAALRRSDETLRITK